MLSTEMGLRVNSFSLSEFHFREIRQKQERGVKSASLHFHFVCHLRARSALNVHEILMMRYLSRALS